LERGVEWYIYSNLPGELAFGTAYKTSNMPDTLKPRNVEVLCKIKTGFGVLIQRDAYLSSIILCEESRT
jgi:hypothetical protein